MTTEKRDLALEELGKLNKMNKQRKRLAGLLRMGDARTEKEEQEVQSLQNALDEHGDEVEDFSAEEIWDGTPSSPEVNISTSNDIDEKIKFLPDGRIIHYKYDCEQGGPKYYFIDKTRALQIMEITSNTLGQTIDRATKQKAALDAEIANRFK